MRGITSQEKEEENHTMDDVAGMTLRCGGRGMFPMQEIT